MKRSSVPTVVLVAAAALVALLVYGVVQQQAGVGSDRLDKAVKSGKRPTAPGLTIARPPIGTGTARSLADFKGKVVVVNFFASWCPPCEEEAPALNRVQDELTSKGDGTIVGISYHDAPDAARGFASRQRLAFPIVRDPDDRLFEGFGNSGLPETFVLDKQGRIADLRRGPVDQAFLDQAITKARAAT